MSYKDRREDWRDDRRDDRRSSIPYKRSSEDSFHRSDSFRSESDYKRMDIDKSLEQANILPEYLKYWLESDKDLNSTTSKSHELELGLGSETRKLEFELFLADLEVNRWENQIEGMEQNLREIDGI